MSPKQAALLAALERGPCTTSDLVHVIRGRDTAQARAYVAVTVWRLTRAGYVIANRNPRGSHKRALYELRGVTCLRCGAVIALDHRYDILCSPCQRAEVDGEGVTA